MRDGQKIDLGLTGYDKLFTTQAQRDQAERETVMEIPLNEISDFPNHPFKVRQDAEMAELVESIKERGILVPGLVRPRPEGGYEMVSGHRRKLASSLAERETMPCVVRELSDDDAVVIMVESNLQREKVLPSEKAFAYKMRLDALKRQGKRSDLTSSPLDNKLKGMTSAQKISKDSGDSQPQIYRFIRLTNLTPKLLDAVDDGKISLRPAVELSYLPEQAQFSLIDAMEYEDRAPSHTQAIKMRKFAEAGKLTEEVILSIMQEEKPNQKEQFKMPKERIAKYFPAGTPPQKMEDTIVKALELYRKRQRDMER